MSGAGISRLVVTFIAAFLTVVPAIADLNESHVFHPDWTAHARLHTVWLISTNSMVAILALLLLWAPTALALRTRVLGASALLGAILGGFMIAGATRSAYAGAFTDPGGVTRQILGIDSNLAGFSLWSVLLIAAAIVAARSER